MCVFCVLCVDLHFLSIWVFCVGVKVCNWWVCLLYVCMCVWVCMGVDECVLSQCV